jgi:hypothetical protein
VYEYIQNTRLQLQIFDIGPSDLGQRAISLTEKGPGVGEPVLRLLAGAEDTLKRDLSGKNAGEKS